jgi:hypothetical protein
LDEEFASRPSAYLGSGPKQHLDGASSVHRLVSLGCLVEEEFEIEDLAWIDLAAEQKRSATRVRGLARAVDGV